MVNHLDSHGQTLNEAVYEEALPARPTKHNCPTRVLVYKAAGGLSSPGTAEQEDQMGTCPPPPPSIFKIIKS